MAQLSHMELCCTQLRNYVVHTSFVINEACQIIKEQCKPLGPTQSTGSLVFNAGLDTVFMPTE